MITKKKLIERVIIVGAIVASIMAVMLGSKLYDYYLSVTYPKSSLYGTWVEQNVASYAASEFVLGPTGVTINGGNVATSYSWDGTYLEYSVGDEKRRFIILNEASTEMRLISQPHYQAVFHVRESQK
ncbi:DUF2850 domain-containing protein [Vibrio ouci]|uniref:DUF2850 domain-containing protein n=1 Tax=Vibrio ouci TaxID=2499078 RepID=A0A4Y8WEX8_9VIBR|nr:DUF2850 domain-containing protein [Vibrio ouci]TFH91389.1 DUF2850 domain-containing protein [Vibrio ouci]